MPLATRNLGGCLACEIAFPVIEAAGVGIAVVGDAQPRADMRHSDSHNCRF